MNNKNPDAEEQTIEGQSRRGFLRKAAYASPVLLTLPAVPSFAQQGSGAGSGDPNGDPNGDPTGDPTGDPIDCDNPLVPIESDVAQNICHFGPSPATSINSDDLIVPNAELDDHIAHGDGIGTCDSFFCGAS